MAINRGPGSSGSVPPEAERIRSGSAASATNRCPKQRFDCTDGFRPVVFRMERALDCHGNDADQREGGWMAGVQITVLKRTVNCDVCEEFGDVAWKLQGGCQPCGTFKDDQRFVSKRGEMPEGFCSWAWADIQRDVTMMRLGGAKDWLKQPGTWLSSCTDGMKPVIFLLERIPAENGGGS